MFFNGELETEVLLNRAGFAPKGGGEPGGGRGEGGRGGGGFSGGFGGGGGGGGRRGGGGGPGGGGPPSEGGGRSPSGETTPRIVASNQPPVQLHLRLTNRGAEPAEIEVVDFNSDLGNFVVQPRKLTLAPGESKEVDPMTSRLGVKADALQLVVRIKRNGKSEQQGLSLEVIPPGMPAVTGAPKAGS